MSRERAAGPSRARVFLVNRACICIVSSAAVASLLWSPASVAAYVVDILLRAYLVFLGTVMAHEAVHGHLGRTRSANMWWGRLALIGSMVPFTNFRKTHRLHHAHTNIPDKDPDYFLRSSSAVEVFLKALAMPHHWFFWLRSRGMIERKDLNELVLNYAGIVAIYAVVLSVVGPVRLLLGMVPTLTITSLLLWYPFAIKTHEGYATGDAELRSHNYYGRAMYWFSLGLSMHRVHHLKPGLSWLDLRAYVEEAPSSGPRWLPRLDVRSISRGA